jgi:hypothetical protein
MLAVRVLHECLHWQLQGMLVLVLVLVSLFLKATRLTVTQEANEATINIYEDDPDHFEFALRVMYT